MDAKDVKSAIRSLVVAAERCEKSVSEECVRLRTAACQIEKMIAEKQQGLITFTWKPVLNYHGFPVEIRECDFLKSNQIKSNQIKSVRFINSKGYALQIMWMSAGINGEAWAKPVRVIDQS